MLAHLSRVCGAMSFALLLSGCATAVYQPLTPTSREQIRSADAVIGVGQQEITAQINQSNITAATGGGLLFALIDAGINSSRSSTAEDAVRPLRDALLSYNYDDNLRIQMNDQLGTVTGMSIGNARVTKDVTDANYNAVYQASNKDAVLITSVNYSMTADFSALTVNATPLLYPKSSGLKASSGLSNADFSSLSIKNAIYRNSISFTSTLPFPSKTLEGNRDLWAANNGQLLIGALNLSADEIASVVSADIQQTAVKGNKPLSGDTFLVSGPGDIQRTRSSIGTIQITSRATPQTLAARPVRSNISYSAAPAAVAPPAAPIMAAPATTAVTTNTTRTVATAPSTASAISPSATPSTSNLQRLQAATVLRDQPKLTARAIASLEAGSPIQQISSMRNNEGEWTFVKAAGQHGWINITSGMTASP
ncbi:MAG: hypothetical protein V4607_04090 [Pseudomonadota bacterium]